MDALSNGGPVRCTLRSLGGVLVGVTLGVWVGGLVGNILEAWAGSGGGITLEGGRWC